jgi:flagellar hook-associated protein 3 FlgL
MSFRVSQRDIYSVTLSNMNSTLAQLQESNIQAATQKRVNKPEDDPAAQARILQLRDSLSQLGQYEKNITMGQGWLTLADSTTTQVNTILTQCKALAEQAATGTMSENNRQQISYQARQLFEQLIGLANTTFDNKSIFAGQRTDQPAYQEVLWLTANDSSLSNASFKITGSAATTALIQFTDPAASAGGTNIALASGASFRYSLDGGRTWASNAHAVSGPAGFTRLNLGAGLAIDMATGTTVRSEPVTGNAASDHNSTAGTTIWVRPTARYLGDDKDKVDVDPLSPQMYASGTKGTAAGVFTNNVMVRIDDTYPGSGTTVHYSYSMDGGRTWVTSNTSSTITATGASLALPGGILTLSNAGGLVVAAGNEYILRPRTADININISPSEKVTINGVGKDIFGGIYQDPASNAARPVTNLASNANMFEVVGKLVGYLETNNQTGVQWCLGALRDASQSILNYAANVGGRENRLTTATTILKNLAEGQTQQLSNAEDVDLSALLTRLAQQQVAYQAVLKSSSMIMQMSLVNYV